MKTKTMKCEKCGTVAAYSYSSPEVGAMVVTVCPRCRSKKTIELSWYEATGTTELVHGGFLTLIEYATDQRALISAPNQTMFEAIIRELGKIHASKN